MVPLLSALRHRLLVRQRKFVYHIVTLDVLRLILEDGIIKPRAAGVCNNYANAELIEKRSHIVLPGEQRLCDAVPFYLSPRQPMFCRLVRERRLTSADIFALGFNFDTLITQTEAQYILMTTNPAYSGARCLRSWEERFCLEWETLCRWRWNCDNETKRVKRLKSAARQAEVDVFSAIPFSLLDHIVVDASMPRVDEQLCRKVVRLRKMNEW